MTIGARAPRVSSPRGEPMAAPDGVSFRYAKGRTMAKKKSKKKGGARGKGRRSNPKHHKGKHRRRRNPRVTFGQALGRVAGGIGVMLVSGALVTVATAKIAPGNPLSLYGIPLLTAVTGAAIA